MATWTRLHRIQLSARVRVLVEVYEPELGQLSEPDDLITHARTLGDLGRVLRRIVEQETQKEQ